MDVDGRGQMISTANAFTKRVLMVALGPIAAGLLVATICGADQLGDAPDDMTVSAELKELTDPTILIPRIWLETEWNKFTDGTHNVEETLGGLWSWRLSPDLDWAVRVKLPLEFHVAGDTPGDSDDAGLGDIKVATGTAIRLCKNWRAGGGLELRMPTGDHDLSDNVWRIQEIGALAWDVTPWFTFSPSFEYNQSLAEEGSAPQHFIETFFPATFILPHGWAITGQYELKADFQNDNYVTNSAKILVAKQLEKVPLSFALSGKRSFDSGEKEFQVNFVVSYFFH
jgi:Putative MetA-pathway of phenol degradation